MFYGELGRIVTPMIGFSLLSLLAVQASQPVPVVTISAAELARAHRLTIAREPVWPVGGEADGPYSFTFIVGGTFMRSGRVAVLEPKPPQVRLFDAGGKHQYTFGRLGLGPGEFSQVQRIVPHIGDSLVVSQIGRVSVFDGFGKHARTLATVNTDAGLALVYRMFPSGLMLASGVPMPTPERQRLNTQQEGLRRDSTRLVILSAQADSIALDLGKRPSGETLLVRDHDRVIVTGRPFSSRLLIEGADSLVVFSPGTVPSVEMISSRTGRSVRTLKLDLPQREVTARDRDDFVRSRRRTEPVLKAMTYPEHMPYFDALRWSYDRVVRLRRYVAPLDSTAQWLSLTPSGQLLSVIDLPAKARVLDFDRDRVLLVERDADDLEYLARYKLVPSKR